MDVLRHWLPIAISALALLVTATFSWSGQVERRSAARLAREKDLHSWAREVGNVYVSLQVGDEKERAHALAQLAVFIDYGRMFFPNEKSKRALIEYVKGRRSRILDPLVETHKRCIAKKDFDSDKCAQDWREFTDQLAIKTTAFAIDTSPEAEGHPQYRNP